MSLVTADLDIRPYRDADEPEVVKLLGRVNGGGPLEARAVDFFRWKHFANPFGRSFILVAEAEGRIIGMRAFMRWELTGTDQRFRAVRAVDTATDPGFRGRCVFSELNRQALGALSSEADFVFNAPSDASLIGFLKMGWQVVGTVPVWVRVHRPVRFMANARSSRSALPESTVESSTRAVPVSDLFREREVRELIAEREKPAGLATPRDLSYLRWRYGDAPMLGYRGAVLRTGDRIEGLAIFRVRRRGKLLEGTVAEIFAKAGGACSRAVLRSAARESRVDYLSCTFLAGAGTPRTPLRSGFFQVPGGRTLVVNALGHHLAPDPTVLRSWALSLGDVGVL